MFSKVLVANRGEIAVRITQTLRAMGIIPVAIYSEPDAASPHVNAAHHSIPLAGNTAEETYLNIPKIIEAARTSGADAIHPGYGFLSENPQFARAAHDAGITFIGPTPENMEALGDKLRSKEIALRAGAPVIPGSPACLPNDPLINEFVNQHGFPLLVKAAAGGGGRGMRLVHQCSDLVSAIESASREAQAAFSDGRVFLERYIPNPRHIEVQVLADASGHTIHLGERECSIQRRYQKIIEETPSPALTPDLRHQMYEAAIAVAREAGYINAGTVEFLLDPHTRRFYFLEMNARLQVEHPITETVLGIDMVQWQLRIANGESLTLHQNDIQPRGHTPLGHAIECRIYAEDPYQDFVPSTGPLLRWRPPSGPGLRLDCGVVEGQTISIYYDHARKAHSLCPRPQSQPPPHGSRPLPVPSAGRCHQHPSAPYSNGSSPVPRRRIRHPLPRMESSRHQPSHFYRNPYDRPSPSRLGLPPTRYPSPPNSRRRHPRQQKPLALRRPSEAPMTQSHGEMRELYPRTGDPYRYTIEESENHFTVDLAPETQNELSTSINLNIESQTPNEGLCRIASGRTHPFAWAWVGPDLHLWLDGALFIFQRPQPRRRGNVSSTQPTAANVLAPMPGVILEVRVAEGDQVDRNQALLIMESMKMELIITASHTGIVRRLAVHPGQQVDRNALLLELSPPTDPAE